MSDELVGLGRFGRDAVQQIASVARAFVTASELESYLGGGKDTEWKEDALSVVADLRDGEALEILETLFRHAWNRARLAAYLVPPADLAVLRHKLSARYLDFPFVFLFPARGRANEIIEEVAKVRAVHMVPEVRDWIFGSLPSPRLADAVRLGGLFRREEREGAKFQEDGDLSKPTSLSRGEAFRARLRMAVEEIRGRRALLALPDGFLTAHERKEMLHWIENVLSEPCEIMQIAGPDGWLYWEMEALLHHALISSGETFGSCSHCGYPSERYSLRGRGLPPLACPRCGRLNRKDWWRCFRHGKNPVYVSTGDDRCPECIRQHHLDSLQVPLAAISVRPDLSKPFHCLHCEDLARANPKHLVYCIPDDIRPYYHDGVYGVERDEFLELTKLHNLPNNCLCPNCGTLLIPVHHRLGRACESAADMARGVMA